MEEAQDIRPLPDIMTTAEAAEYLRVTAEFLLDRAKEPGGPPCFPFGRGMVFSRYQLREWIEKQALSRSQEMIKTSKAETLKTVPIKSKRRKALVNH